MDIREDSRLPTTQAEERFELQLISGALPAGGQDAIHSIIATHGSPTTTSSSPLALPKMPFKSPKTSLEVLERANNASQGVAQPVNLAQQPRLSPEYGSLTSLDRPSRFPLPPSNASSEHPYIISVLPHSSPKPSNARPHQHSAALSNLVYENRVHQLSQQFPYLDSVLSQSRHDSATLTIFDYSGDVLRGAKQLSTNFHVGKPLRDTQNFLNGKSSWSDVDTRLVVLEDIGPTLIRLLGSTFNISPEFFAEHLHRSGYRGGKENDAPPSAWRTSNMHKNYVSVKWYRPGNRWIQEPNTLLQRRAILDPEAEALRGIEHVQNNVSGDTTDIEYTLQTKTNIFRPEFALSTDPDDVIPEQAPCAWEERATACTVEFDGLRYGSS